MEAKQFSNPEPKNEEAFAKLQDKASKQWCVEWREAESRKRERQGGRMVCRVKDILLLRAPHSGLWVGLHQRGEVANFYQSHYIIEGIECGCKNVGIS